MLFEKKTIMLFKKKNDRKIDMDFLVQFSNLVTRCELRTSVFNQSNAT